MSLTIGLILILFGLGLRLWWIREQEIRNSLSDRNIPTWPRLLMGLGLAISTGNLIVLGAGLLAGIVWWLEVQSESSNQTENPNNFIPGLNPIWGEVVLGIGMFLLAIFTFSIRSV